MYVLIIVWLTATGTLSGEPWRDFPDKKACETAKAAIPVPADRFIFAAGCLDKALIHDFTGFYFDLHSSEKNEKPI